MPLGVRGRTGRNSPCQFSNPESVIKKRITDHQLPITDSKSDHRLLITDCPTMTLYALKPRFQGLLRPLVARLAASGGTANQVTVAAAVGSVAVACLVIW